jgi:anaerobic ribonucleoside-triphosphate reductase activating protein
LWLQGCTLACPGCFNADTHSVKNEKLYKVTEVFDWIANARSTEGLTVSGGEPLQQAAALVELLELVRQRTSLSILVFTGFSFEEAQALPQFNQLRTLVDVLITGRYVAGMQIRSSFLGSANKTIHFLSDRYSEADLEAAPVSEVIINPSGDLTITGIEPSNLRNK